MDNNYLLQNSPEALMKAMQSEQKAIAYYEQLLKLSQDVQDTELIADIRDDEVKHFSAFQSLYIALTDQKPRLPYPETPHIGSFTEGLKHSVIDELNAYEFYRDVLLANKNADMRSVFLEAMTDEMEHAEKFNFMFTKTLEKAAR